MNIDELKTIFVNIGSVIIALILAIGQLYTIWKIKKQETLAKKTIDKKDYGKAIKEENNYALDIQEQLEELRQALNADRTQIIEFHNGTDFSTRKGYKMDCTYESVKYGNESIKSLLQNYPTTMLPVFISKIMDEKKYFVPNVETIKEKDMSTYAMKLNMGVSAFYDIALESENTVFGILVVQFNEAKQLNEHDLAMLAAKKIIVEELLK